MVRAASERLGGEPVKYVMFYEPSDDVLSTAPIHYPPARRVSSSSTATGSS